MAVALSSSWADVITAVGTTAAGQARIVCTGQIINTTGSAALVRLYLTRDGTAITSWHQHSVPAGSGIGPDFSMRILRTETAGQHTYKLVGMVDGSATLQEVSITVEQGDPLS